MKTDVIATAIQARRRRRFGDGLGLRGDVEVMSGPTVCDARGEAATSQGESEGLGVTGSAQRAVSGETGDFRS